MKGSFSYAGSLVLNEVSDKMLNRSFLGNSEIPWEGGVAPSRHPGKRRLVEECEAVSVYAVQKAYGKNALIAAIRQARPFRLPVSGGHFDIWLIDEPHRLPGRHEQWSSLEAGTARLWLICTNCRQKVAKLYYYYFDFGSLALSDLACRNCHTLVYQSTNCGSNRWYRQVVRPMKQLLREKSRLLRRECTPRVASRMIQIENEMRRLAQILKPRTRGRDQLSRGFSSQKRRPYRDLELLA